MSASNVLDFLSSRAFLAFGVPSLSLSAEWIIRLTAKKDQEPVFAWKDLDYGISLLATAFVSIPALLAARASALEAVSRGNQNVHDSTLALAAIGMVLIALVAMVMGVYERRVGRHFREETHRPFLTPLLGVFVPLMIGSTTLSLVYVLTPTGG